VPKVSLVAGAQTPPICWVDFASERVHDRRKKRGARKTPSHAENIEELLKRPWRETRWDELKERWRQEDPSRSDADFSEFLQIDAGSAWSSNELIEMTIEFTLRDFEGVKRQDIIGQEMISQQSPVPKEFELLSKRADAVLDRVGTDPKFLQDGVTTQRWNELLAESRAEVERRSTRLTAV
jgi:hypothetical protein